MSRARGIICARRIATLESFSRQAADSPAASPPAANRLATTTSACPCRSVASISGSRASSCCRSPSITATTGAELDSAPSITAEDSPRRPTRRMHRTRSSEAAIARTAAAVPSGLSSSTNTASHATPASAASSRDTSTATFCRSL